jgi:hypothetical protein
MVTNLFARFANIRPAAEHALIGHHTNCEVVDRRRMVLPAHDLRSHVAWCARSVLGVVFTPDASNAEVSNADVA